MAHLFQVGAGSGGMPVLDMLCRDPRISQITLIEPDIYKPHAHHWLILHGRYICKAQRPACDRCLISDLCLWGEKSV